MPVPSGMEEEVEEELVVVVVALDGGFCGLSLLP